jgi:hypothetical protein
MTTGTAYTPSKVVPQPGLDYSIVDANNVEGGHHTYATTTARDAALTATPGKFVVGQSTAYVTATATTYRLTGSSTWTVVPAGGTGPSPVNVRKAYAVVGDGTTDDRAAVLTASAASAGKTLFFEAPGNVTTTYKLSADTALGQNVGLWVEQGGIIDGNGFTLTIDGPLYVGDRQQWLTPGTKLRFAQWYRNLAVPSPYWWGAKADAATTFDDGPALQQWIDSITGPTFAGGAEALIPAAVFQTRQQLNMVGNAGSSIKITGSIASYAGRGSAIRHLGTPIASSTNPSGAPVVFTTDRPHGMSTIDRVKITGHTGNTAVAAWGISGGLSGQVTVLSTTTFSIDGLVGNGGAAGGATGTAGGAVLSMKGVNNSRFEGITFDGTGKTNQCVWYRTNQLLGGAGANGMFFEHCAFQGACGELSNLLGIGDYGSNTGGNTYQAAEVNCVECNFNGSADTTNIETMTDACWRMLQGGNVKDNAVRDSNFFGANVIFDDSQASGTQLFDNCEMGGAYRYSFLVGGSQTRIVNCASENANGTYAGGIFISTLGTGGAGVGSLSLEDNQIVSPVWDQTVPITSVSNANGVNRVVRCAQLPRYAGVGDSIVIDGNTDAAVNGTCTITAVNMRNNEFTINVTGTGGAVGTGGQYLHVAADGLFISYPDHLRLASNYFDASDVALKKYGAPIIASGLLVPSYPSAGSVDSQDNTYRFGQIGLPGEAVAISSSTATTPITINTTAAHKKFPGDLVCIQSHRGNTAALGIWKVGAVPSTTSLTLLTTAGANSVGTVAGGATGRLVHVRHDGIPVQDSGGICTGRGVYAQQSLNLFSRGDSAGDPSTGTNKPLAPRNGWAMRSGELGPNLSAITPGVRVLSSGETTGGRAIFEVDWNLVKASQPYGGTAQLARVTLCRLKQNQVIKNVGAVVVTTFAPGTSMMVGTSDTAYADNLLDGGTAGQYGGVVVSAAAGTMYPSAETDNGADMLRGALIQGGCWRARGTSTIDVIATFVGSDLSVLTAGVVRVYLDLNNFLVDYYP